MDLIQYFSDLNKTQSQLERDLPNQPIYITSVFNRDRNSTAGTTYTASPRNAARVITDGTHRLATPVEIAAFEELQQRNLEATLKSEQRKNKQFVVMVDPAAAGLSNFAPPMKPASAGKSPTEASSTK